MKSPKIDKEIILRRLFDSLATYMAQGTTFNEIARLLFVHGLILKPEKPYGVYEGSKKDYMLEKLIDAQKIGGFPQKLADLIWEITVPESWGETREINWALDSLGFKIINEALERKAPKKLPKIKQRIKKVEKQKDEDTERLNWVYYTNIFWLIKQTSVFIWKHKFISFALVILGLLATDYSMAWRNIKAIVNFIRSLF